MNRSGKQRSPPSEPEEIRRYCKGLGFTRNSAVDAAVSRSRRVGDDAIASVPFGAIEGLVGALQNGRGGIVSGKRRKSDRERDVDRFGALVDGERLTRDAPADALRDQR